ncbi:MAG: hypothetical protein WCF53_02780, partial [Pseudolabrys sp.]
LPPWRRVRLLDCQVQRSQSLGGGPDRPPIPGTAHIGLEPSEIRSIRIGVNPVMGRCPLHDRSSTESGSRFAI